MKLFNVFLYSLIFFAITTVITILYTPPTSQDHSSSPLPNRIKALIRTKNSRKKSAPSQPPPPPPPPPAIEPYDYLMLATTWPPTFCKVHTCVQSTPNRFILHGLWPGKYKGTMPVDGCTDKTAKFDTNQLNSVLVTNLENQWPYIIQDPGGKFTLWINQWNKHGSCTGLDQTTYYKLAMEMYGRVNIRDALKSKKMEPTTKMSKNYGPLKRKDIAKALQQHFDQFVVQLDCLEHENKLYLHEVRVCYEVADTKQLKNCPSAWTNSCYKEDIYYTF